MASTWTPGLRLAGTVGSRMAPGRTLGLPSTEGVTGDVATGTRCRRGSRSRRSSALVGACLLLGATGANATMIGPLDLGEAGDLGLAFYALSGSMRASPSATAITGNLGLGDGVAAAKFVGPFSATISGTFHVDPLALVPPSLADDVVATDLSAAANALRNAALGAASMTPTQTFDKIRLTGGTSERITATEQVNVVRTGKITMSGGSTLVLEGGRDQFFIINAEDLDIKGASRIILEGGLTPGNVLFNARNDVKVSASSSFNGYLFCLTFVTPSDVYTCDQTTIHSSTVNGALFSESLRISSGSRLNFVSAAPQEPPHGIAEPGALALLGFGLLGLTLGRRRRT